MKRQTRMRITEDGTTIKEELPLVDADVFDPDLMITSPNTRRPKKFTFEIDDAGVSKHNNGFSDHFPIITTIQTEP